jgi:hypothetical protein
MELITFTTDERGITINIPVEILINATLNAPEPIEVFNQTKFVEQVAFELQHNLGQNESGLTGFQQLLDEACSEVAQQGTYADFIDLG